MLSATISERWPLAWPRPVWRIYQAKWASSFFGRSSETPAPYFSFRSCTVSSVRSFIPKASSLNSNSNRRCTSLLFSRKSAMSLWSPQRIRAGAPSLLRIRAKSLSNWLTSLALLVGRSLWAFVISSMPSFIPSRFSSSLEANSAQSAASTSFAAFLTTPLARILSAIRCAMKCLPLPESPNTRLSMPMRAPPAVTSFATRSFSSRRSSSGTMLSFAIRPFCEDSLASVAPQNLQYFASGLFSLPQLVHFMSFLLFL